MRGNFLQCDERENLFPKGWDDGKLQPRPRFPTGTVIVSRNAHAALARSGQDVEFFLRKHTCGDWGALDALKAAVNEFNLRSAGKIVSIHNTLMGEVIVIHTNGNRTGTCVLLASE